MDGGAGVLVVYGFAVPEGRNKWACCFELRLRSERSEALLYRGELHGCAYRTEQAAQVAAWEAGEREARRRVAAGVAASYTLACALIAGGLDPAPAEPASRPPGAITMTQR